MGKIIAPDPVGLTGGLNLYAYAPNPLTWIDPLGLSKCSSSGKPDTRFLCWVCWAECDHALHSVSSYEI
ncbi:RHS repeat-associated core domain-containing protein [Brenneria sp. L4-2C]|uniref:RHS repeat-associated core domain-containing protein n=1 Tax=unclassified Brenneria TaxID=2634434 RepID=UPI0032EF74AB